MAYDIGPKIGIDGEAEFRKQIKQVATQVKTLGTEMGAVTAQFAKNASSQEALAAKTGVLNRQIEAQKEKLRLQQDMLDKAAKKFGTADERTQKWQQTVNRTTKDLYDLENAVEDTGDELDNATDKAFSFGDALKASVLADFVVEGIQKAANGLRDFASGMLDAAASVKANKSQFTQTFKDMGEEAKEAISEVADDSGILETRLQGLSTSLYSFSRASGGTEEEAMDIMARGLQVAADSAAYYDRSLEDTAETLQSFLKGNYENDAALGLSATETTRNAAAMELFGTKFKELTEIQKQQTLLKMVEDAMELSGAMGQAQREADGWENVQGNLNEAMTQFQAAVGLPFLAQITPLVQSVTSAIVDLTENTDWDAFSKGVAGAFDILKQLLQGDVSGLQNLQEKLWGGLLSGIFNLGDYLKNNMPDMTETALALISSLAKKLREQAGQLVDSAIGLAQNFIQGFADSFPVIIEKLPGIISDIAGVINDNAPKILAAGINMIGALLNGMIEAIPTLIANLPQIIEAIWNTITAVNWVSLGAKLVTGIGNGIKSMAKFVKDQAKAIGDDVVGFFKGLPAKLKEIGKNLIQGFVDGIQAKFESAIKNVKGIAQSVTAVFSSEWDVHSPSRVMKAMGGYLMEGLERGILGGQERVYDAMRTVDAGMQGMMTAGAGYTGLTNHQFHSGLAEAVNAMSAAGRMQPIQVTVPVTLNGRIVGQAVTEFQLNEGRAMG